MEADIRAMYSFYKVVHAQMHFDLFLSYPESMDNLRRRLHSYLGVGAKTSLGVCLNELKH
jgi:hypothetical protein